MHIQSIEELRNKAKELFVKHNLTNWSFDFDHAKRRFGYCCYTPKRITMSLPLVSANLGSPQLLDTLLHEIAHAIAFIRYGRSQNHNYNWKRICVEIGANPNRCCNSKEVNTIRGRFVYKCKHCGHIVYAHKKWKRTKAHGKCCNTFGNGKFSTQFELEFIGVN